jgi:hypothetical protein
MHAGDCSVAASPYAASAIVVAGDITDEAIRLLQLRAKVPIFA